MLHLTIAKQYNIMDHQEVFSAYTNIYFFLVYRLSKSTGANLAESGSFLVMIGLMVSSLSIIILVH